MTAANPLPQDRSAEQRAHEPSMEEILASIRRIIADDHAFPAPRPAAPAAEMPVTAPVAPEPSLPEVEFADVPPVHEPALPSLAQDNRAPDELAALAHEAPTPSAFAQHVAEVPAEDLAMPADDDTLHLLRRGADPLAGEPPAVISPAAEVPPAPPHHVAETRVAETPLVSPATDAAVGSSFNALIASHFIQNSGMLADIARDMLRPMLKAWLDDNLPIMVERLVRAEIERVARGGR